jgi:ABC-type glycerol-3-phosphate transport system permease component
MKYRVRRGKVNRSVGGDIGVFIFLAMGGIFMALPMVYAISNAFKPLDEMWIFPPRFFVRNPTLKNFSDLFILMANSWVPFSRYMANTVLISVVGTAGHVIIASLCAYPLAKHKFPGSQAFFRMIVLALMFHASVTAIPNYMVMAKVGWINSHASLIIPAFAMPLGLYLMKQFMEEVVPDSVLESAKIDGASEWLIFWKIVMPMVKPAWLTLIIFSFQSLWNIGDNVFIYSEELKTLPFALGQIMSAGIARAGVGAAVQVMMMIVPVVIFIVSQSNIVETMATSGMKE